MCALFRTRRRCTHSPSARIPATGLVPVWIIVNYLVWKGLAHYGFNDAANDLAYKTIRLLE